jgi:asparagine synthase (glutamine-hydrolysing)
MFAGVISFSPDMQPREILDVMACRTALSPFHQPDKEGVWEEGPALLIEARVYNTPQSYHETPPCRCLETGVVVAFWGRLDNRRDLSASLDIDRDRMTAMTDPQLVLAAWHRWGEAMPAYLLGDFVLAVVDVRGRRVFLARDPLGVKPLYYRRDHKSLIFSTTAAVFCTLKISAAPPDLDWLAHYLTDLSIKDQQTGLTGVLKFPPGHSLMVREADTGEPQRWFAWRDDAPPAKERDPRWVDEYRAILEEAIRCRMSSHHPLGTENSGGIDSATITAYLARILGVPNDNLHGFSAATDEQEPAFILATSQHCRVLHNYVMPAFLAPDWTIQDRSLKILGYPEQHGSASGHIPFYRECALRGIRTLFSGFGGDEAVTHLGGHLRMELLDGGHYRQLFDILPGNLATRTLRLVKDLVMGRKSPEYNTDYLASWKARWPYEIIRDEVAGRLCFIEQTLNVSRFGAPFRRINDFVLWLISEPYVATRMENGTLMAASYGVEYRWPLWDVRLVQQYLSTPSIEKVGPRGIGRYLHRRAIAGILPHSVVWKPTKSMGKSLVLKELNTTVLISMAKIARQQEACLHPALESLIDRDKFRTQIRWVEQGFINDSFAAAFRRNTRNIQYINHWLYGSAVG